MSAPFAQSVAGRVLSINVTPLRTPPASRKYSLTFIPTNTTAPTELIVNSIWLPHDQLEVTVTGLKASWSLKLAIPGARLTDGVAYTASTKVVVGHNQTMMGAAAGGGAVAAPVTITITQQNTSRTIF